MKTILASLSLVGAMTMASSAFAAQDYDFVQLNGVVKSEYSDIDEFDLKGFELRGSKSFGSNFFGELRYRDLDDSFSGVDFDESRWNASLGYVIPMSNKVHFDVRANYGDIDVELSNGDESIGFDTKYYGVSGYAHYGLTQDINLYAGLEYQKLDIDEGDDQKAYHLGATYTFDAVSVGTEYVKYSDSDALSLFVRYSF